jgi:hypothetical protein
MIKNFITYLFGKKSELADLSAKDALLAKVILDIHRKRTHSKFVFVPLSSLKPIHAIDCENALLTTAKRTDKLREVKEELIAKHRLTREVLAEYLPSISSIKVVQESVNSVIAYEGNGRLAALQSVFESADDIMVEVEEYCFRNPKKILRRMNRVRRLNGLC